MRNATHAMHIRLKKIFWCRVTSQIGDLTGPPPQDAADSPSPRCRGLHSTHPTIGKRRELLRTQPTPLFEFLQSVSPPPLPHARIRQNGRERGVCWWYRGGCGQRGLGGQAAPPAVGCLGDDGRPGVPGSLLIGPLRAFRHLGQCTRPADVRGSLPGAHSHWTRLLDTNVRLSL